MNNKAQALFADITARKILAPGVSLEMVAEFLTSPRGTKFFGLVPWGEVKQKITSASRGRGVESAVTSARNLVDKYSLQDVAELFEDVFLSLYTMDYMNELYKR